MDNKDSGITFADVNLRDREEDVSGGSVAMRK